MTSHETIVSEERYMECLLGIDTTTGWEKSVTKVLTSFQDLSFDIDPSMGLAYVKGKIDPHLVLKKLKKGGKHAKIHWLTYGRHTDCDQYSGPIQLQPYPQFPRTYTNYDHPYNNYHHLYGHYNNPLHNNNNPGHHLFPNNAPPLQPSRRRQQRRSSDHPHKRNSPEPSPFKPSTSSQGRVTEPVVKRRTAAFIGLDQFIKQVVSIKKLTEKKFQSCFGLCLSSGAEFKQSSPMLKAIFISSISDAGANCRLVSRTSICDLLFLLTQSAICTPSGILGSIGSFPVSTSSITIPYSRPCAASNKILYLIPHSKARYTTPVDPLPTTFSSVKHLSTCSTVKFSLWNGVNCHVHELPISVSLSLAILLSFKTKSISIVMSITANTASNPITSLTICDLFMPLDRFVLPALLEEHVS
ncbi:heavy metal-associated isoprenylated plant protein 32-like [Senna tora]|uniref:Heavy metal-associated isoprenylated plant protein 32-like n=1 Tax=Senna tora TaxID=362788 RepID=A0A834X467_9FABA|nr:heavy metal-associated isoprenylated plant protein 32-like [Senna tora]KAF7837356.1 heavy metal-associated isoprenylated plant protein 32-like [Senna tora]